MNPDTSQSFRFELNVEGMTCVKCTEKVEAGLKALTTPVENVKVDFISNKVLFSTSNQAAITEVIEKLNSLSFKVKDYKDISFSANSEFRTLRLKANKEDDCKLIKKTLLAECKSLKNEDIQHIGDKCTIVYNPTVIRGSEILAKLNETQQYKDGSFSYSIEDFFDDNMKNITFSEFSIYRVVLVCLFNIGLVVLSLITKPDDMMYPMKNGMYSYYYIAVFVLTMLTLCTVALKIYFNSFKRLFRNKNVNMMTLVSFGSGMALIFGLIYMVWGTVHMITGTLTDPEYFIMNGTEMFFTSSVILTAVVLGKYVEGKIKKRVYARIEELKGQLKVSAGAVTRLIPKNKRFLVLSLEELHPSLVEKDDYILIKTQGGMIPFDGFIEKGTIKIVENIQYGWEKTEVKTKGHPIMSGSQVVDVQEEAVIRVTEPLEKTLAGKLFYEIKEAASGSSTDKTKNADLLAKITKHFISVVVTIAIITFAAWLTALIIGRKHGVDYRYSYPFEKAIAVLVASCPCALGIAIPMVYAIALRKGFRAGVLIKDTSSLDTLHTVNAIIFDKTGTITGTYNIKNVDNVAGQYDEASLWEIITLLEKNHIQHPIGLALYQESLQRVAKLENAKHNISRENEDKSLHEYIGSEGIIDRSIKIGSQSVTVCLGNKKILNRLKIKSSQISSPSGITLSNNATASGFGSDLEEDGEICLYLCIDDEVHFKIYLSLKESLKNNVIHLISKLQKRKKEIFILSGDSQANANQIGLELNIPQENIFAGLTPEGKEHHVNRLTKTLGKKVMMVGDGINDIKAFQSATVSCSINFKSSQNLTFSDFIIIDNDIENLAAMFKLASALTRFKIVILVCALLYNIPTIVTAAGALVPIWGIDLPAFMAAWTMVAFSVFLTCVANLMEFVVIKKGSKDLSRFTKRASSAIKRRLSSARKVSTTAEHIEIGSVREPLMESQVY